MMSWDNQYEADAIILSCSDFRNGEDHLIFNNE